MHIKTSFGIFILFIVPVVVRAQTLFDILLGINGILQTLFPVAILLATAAFLWGMAKFIARAGSDQGREEGKRIMVWGVIALFVIISIWGIVSFLGDVFGVDEGGTCPPPQIGVNTVSSC